MKTIAELRALLISAQKLTGTSSYERRVPAARAVPALLQAKDDIAAFIAVDTGNAEAYRLLSLVQECLLNYPDARKNFEKALALAGQRSSKEIKHLALLREYESKWAAFPLTPEELQSLGRYLADHLAEQGCDHSTRHTKAWLVQHALGKPEHKLKALRHWGGYCDCEVLANAVQSEA
ncbi:DUF2695 domain-containing protein [Chitinibacteraceae bacterium HSL-7]